MNCLIVITWELHHSIDLKTVSATLGHSSVTSTEIYAKTLEADVKLSCAS